MELVLLLLSMYQVKNSLSKNTLYA
jgi:hypothetical protein